MRRLLPALFVTAACLLGPVGQASAAHVYWAESNTGIQRADELGQDVTTIDGAGGGSVAVDDAHVYSSSYDGSQGGFIIRRTELDGQNADPTWLTGIGGGAGFHLAAGGGHVCWTRGYTPQGANYEKYEVVCVTVDDSGAHSSPQLVYETVNETLNDVAVNAQHVYWTHLPLINNGTPGEIARGDL